VGPPESAPRAAVVIPCYNDPAVPEAVASVRLQEPCELVVVDDGSTDPAGLAALAAVRAEGVQVVRQENQGLSAARMTGVRHTTAPFIFPLDSDDLLAPGAIARLADALETHPEAAVAYGDVELFGASNAFFDNSGKGLDPWWITYASTVPGTSLVRRDALLAAGGWQLNEGGYEDWDLWMRFAELGFRDVYVPGLMFSYRIYPAGRMWASAMEKHEALYARLRERHPELFARRRVNRRRSIAPRRVRMLYPVIARLPTSQATRRRFFDLVAHPGHIVLPRLGRIGRLAVALAPRR
jgi:glycosyltransferase involved in cell wall biosynthesis